jgi:hypothetical protein
VDALCDQPILRQTISFFWIKFDVTSQSGAEGFRHFGLKLPENINIFDFVRQVESFCPLSFPYRRAP